MKDNILALLQYSTDEMPVHPSLVSIAVVTLGPFTCIKRRDGLRRHSQRI